MSRHTHRTHSAHKLDQRNQEQSKRANKFHYISKLWCDVHIPSSSIVRIGLRLKFLFRSSIDRLQLFDCCRCCYWDSRKLIHMNWAWVINCSSNAMTLRTIIACACHWIKIALLAKIITSKWQNDNSCRTQWNTHSENSRLATSIKIWISHRWIWACAEYVTATDQCFKLKLQW